MLYLRKTVSNTRHMEDNVNIFYSRYVTTVEKL